MWTVFRKPLPWLAALAISALLALPPLALAHNTTLAGTIDPPDGSTISSTSTAVSGTFGVSGCGLGATITGWASSGNLTFGPSTCVDGVWSWQATWDSYAEGTQTVTVSFYTTHGGNGNGNSPTFVHHGSVSATYTVDFACEEPAAPAIAGSYMKWTLGIDPNTQTYRDVIEAVAHETGNGIFGNDPCAPGYADAVRAFVDGLLV